MSRTQRETITFHAFLLLHRIEYLFFHVFCSMSARNQIEKRTTNVFTQSPRLTRSTGSSVYYVRVNANVSHNFGWLNDGKNRKWKEKKKSERRKKNGKQIVGASFCLAAVIDLGSTEVQESSEKSDLNCLLGIVLLNFFFSRLIGSLCYWIRQIQSDRLPCGHSSALWSKFNGILSE